MDKIEKIRQEIERRKNDTLNSIAELGNSESERLGLFSFISEYDELLSFLDTLSVEPDKSLEEAAEEYAVPCDLSNFEKGEPLFNCYDMADAFIAGAKWQKNQMLKDAVEGVLVDNIDGTQDICLYEKRFGDKVKVIVLKEEE